MSQSNSNKSNAECCICPRPVWICRRANSRWLPSLPSWMSGRGHHWKEPSSYIELTPKKISCQTPERFSSYLTETEFKMAATAAILDIRQQPSSKITFLSKTATTKKKFQVKRMNGSEVIWRKPNSRWLPQPPSWMSSGSHHRKEPSSHREQPPKKKFQVKRVNGCQVIWRKPNSRWLP